MKYQILLKGILLSFISIALLFPAYVSSDSRKDNQKERRSDKKKNKHKNNLKFDRRGNHQSKRRYEVRHGNKLVVVTPRRRSFRNIVVIRPHGHAYHGYGHFHLDNDAWKWLAFTAITLKVMDMLDEQAQREHEAAQVKATTAAVGEKIVWEAQDSSGYVVTTKKGTSNSGLSCREFQQKITVGGKTEEAYGTACLQADGSWKISP